MKLNITNGENFNNYLCKQTKELCIPFNEALIEGDVIEDIFSKKFINIRSNYHNVTNDKYLDKLSVFIQTMNTVNDYDEVTLWFGKDAFCIINLLGVIETLIKCNYKNIVNINFIDDYTFKTLDKMRIDINNYKNVYDKVFIKKEFVSINKIIDEGIKLYLDFHNRKGKLQTLILDNYKLLSKEKLFELIWNNSREYGLGDTQLYNLIRQYEAHI